MTIQTAGELRGFLADVLLDIRAKRIKPDEAAAIAKVAGEINRSLAVEVQTALQSGVKKPVPGSMVITAEAGTDEPVQKVHQLPDANSTTEQLAKSPKTVPVAIPPLPKSDGEKVWCEQCEMRVTVGQAIGCKSPFCKAKEAA